MIFMPILEALKSHEFCITIPEKSGNKIPAFYTFILTCIFLTHTNQIRFSNKKIKPKSPNNHNKIDTQDQIRFIPFVGKSKHDRRILRSVKHNDSIINFDLTQRCLYHQKIKGKFCIFSYQQGLILFQTSSSLNPSFSFTFLTFFFLSKLWMSFEMLENVIKFSALSHPQTVYFSP